MHFFGPCSSPALYPELEIQDVSFASCLKSDCSFFIRPRYLVFSSLGGCIFGVCRAAFVAVLALVFVYVACMLGGFRARACMLSCCVFVFVGVPVGRSGPLGSLSSRSLFLPFHLSLFFALPFPSLSVSLLCLSIMQCIKRVTRRTTAQSALSGTMS